MKSPLSKLRNPHGEYLLDKRENFDVYHVETPQLFVQAAGYLKHIHGKAGPKTVLYRGQGQLHGGSLKPSLYRNATSFRGLSKFNEELNAFLGSIKTDGKVMRHVDEHVREPLMQHYGIRTRWLDVVDNVWVALWFACYEARAVGRQGEYLHFEQRKPARNPHAYVVLVEADWNPVPSEPGCYEGPVTKSIDLRVAAPSTFIRPHAQHAVLVRMRPTPDKQVLDYKSLVAGVIRVDLKDALDWLGSGTLLTTHVLFPSPVYDFGYLELLNLSPASKHLGAINHVGA